MDYVLGKYQRTLRRRVKTGAVAATAVFAASAAISPAVADDESARVAQFYKGKTIDMLVGLSAGGGYDIFARILGRHIGKHIPGSPTVVVRNMTGGGGRVVTSYVYTIAPKDGTVLATTDRALVLQQAIGDDSINFDMRKLSWIGNGDSDNGTFAVWHTSGINSIEDAKKREVVLGATGWNATSQYALALNAIAGTKFKIVIGYPGGNHINVAMERNEVAGRASVPYSLWIATRKAWVDEGKIKFIAQIGLKPDPKMPDAPLLVDLASNDIDKAALRLLSAPLAIGLPLFSSPGVPPERVRALRQAFDATVADKEFITSAQQANLKVDATSGEEVRKMIEELLDTPKAVVARLNEVITPPK